ncbi:uncharacterized protein [Ambystoma mexicanum]|uniref:uncharacterized protein n=1 Tax=Ambystoma mexicanum TaxID=8296 RepID=UPI0037E8A683
MREKLTEHEVTPHVTGDTPEEIERCKPLKSFYGMEARIMILGLDDVGKTIILYRLKLNETMTTIPTLGYDVEILEPMKNDVSFTIWDVGGQIRIWHLWRHYFANTDGLLFVLDRADPERFEEAHLELVAILENDAMWGVPVVVLAKKQDLVEARSTSVLVEELGLLKPMGHEWHVQGCCTTIGDGLVEGMEKMAEMVKQCGKTGSF